MKVRWGMILTVFAVVCLVISNPVFADQADNGDDGSDDQDKPTTRQDDDRLPPVLPGEEVVTQTGQKMRVWSSAGPVPLNVQPTPQTLNGGYGYGGPAVIVDGREFEGRGIPGR